MASNLYKGFTIEHDPTRRRSVSCKDCEHYDKCDGSCNKTSCIPKEEGFDLWKYCKYFELSDAAENYDIKAKKYKKAVNHRAIRSEIVSKKKSKRNKEIKYDWSSKPYSFLTDAYRSVKPKAVIKPK